MKQRPGTSKDATDKLVKGNLSVYCHDGQFFPSTEKPRAEVEACLGFQRPLVKPCEPKG
jgi:hypothetical protein